LPHDAHENVAELRAGFGFARSCSGCSVKTGESEGTLTKQVRDRFSNLSELWDRFSNLSELWDGFSNLSELWDGFSNLSELWDGFSNLSELWDRFSNLSFDRLESRSHRYC